MTWIFKHWQDGDVNVQKTLTVTGDITLTAYYEEVAPPVVQAGFPIWLIPVVLIAMGAIYIVSKKK